MNYIKLKDDNYVITDIDKNNLMKNSNRDNILTLAYYDKNDGKCIISGEQNYRKINRNVVNIIKNKKEIMLDIYVENEYFIEKAIKDIIKIGNICKKYNIQLGTSFENKILVANIAKYTNNEKIYREILNSLTAVLYKDKKGKYNYLYDTICDYLDNEFIKKKLCGFKNDKCKVKESSGVTMGCCYHCKNKRFGLLYTNKFQVCEYLKDKRCSAKCITCKLFTCDELEKEGVKYNTNNILLIKCFFNPLQKFIIISSHFTPKEKIMERLLICSRR